MPSTGEIFHSSSGDDKNWSSYQWLQKMTVGAPYVKVGAASLNGTLHVLALNAKGYIYHTSQNADGSWSDAENVNATLSDPRQFGDFACATRHFPVPGGASLQESLSVVALQSDKAATGAVVQTALVPGGQWLPFSVQTPFTGGTSGISAFCGKGDLLWVTILAGGLVYRGGYGCPQTGQPAVWAFPFAPVPGNAPAAPGAPPKPGYFIESAVGDDGLDCLVAAADLATFQLSLQRDDHGGAGGVRWKPDYSLVSVMVPPARNRPTDPPVNGVPVHPLSFYALSDQFDIGAGLLVKAANGSCFLGEFRATSSPGWTNFRFGPDELVVGGPVAAAAAVRADDRNLHVLAVAG